MKLEAEKRQSGHNNQVRRAGRLPAVVYNKELNVPVSVDFRTFDKVFRSQGTANLIDLNVEGDTHQVLVREVQMDKRRRVPLHVDFYAITKGQKVNVGIPIEFVGTSAGQRDGGMLDVKRREVIIDVLPAEIPNTLEVDISDMNIGDSIHISDLRSLLPQTAEIVDDESLTIITVVASRTSVEAAAEEDGAAAITEPEVIGEKSDEDDAEGSDEG
jgi:large subunit ribosomal protein L25